MSSTNYLGKLDKEYRLTLFEIRGNLKVYPTIIIIRIMKKFKTLSLNLFYMEIIQRLDFILGFTRTTDFRSSDLM